MKCIYCKHANSKVIDSRYNPDNNSIRRRRECLKCGKRFTTYETVELTPILVVKSDGRLEPYDVSKIRAGIVKSFYKRPISVQQIDELVSRIDESISKSAMTEIPSKKIGEMVMNEIKQIDEIAYIRYACVYRNFKDVTNLLNYLRSDFREQNISLTKKSADSAQNEPKTKDTKPTPKSKSTTKVNSKSTKSTSKSKSKKSK